MMEHTCPTIIILQVGKDLTGFMRHPILVVRRNPKGKRFIASTLSDLSATAVYGCCIHSSPNGCQRLRFKSHFFFRISLYFLISPSSSPISLSFSLSLSKHTLCFLDFSSTLLCFSLHCSVLFSFLFHVVILKAQRNDATTKPRDQHMYTVSAPQAKDVSVKYLHF